MKKILDKKILLIVALVCVLTFAMMLSACDLLFPVRLTGIEATYSGGDVAVGDNLDVSKVTVGASYSNRDSKEVTGWTLSDLDTSTVGEKTVTVTYTEKDVTLTDTFDVKVVPVALESLSVTYSGGPVFVGGTLDKTSIVVTAIYNSKSVADKPVTDYTLSGFESATAGVKTVKVSYTEDGVTATTTFTVEVVKAKLKSISAIYTGGDLIVGDSLDRRKITVTATYDDNTTKTVTSWTCSGFDSSSAGSKTVTVSYTDDGITATTTFTVNVYAFALDRITAEYVGGDIFVGDEIDRTKLTVTAYLVNGSAETVENYTLSPTSFAAAGDKQTVTVSYKVGTVTKTTTFTVNVKSLVLESLTVEYKGGSVAIGAQPKKSDFVVTARYTNGKTVTVTDFELEFDSSEAGEKPCKILYGGQSTTVNITVTDGPKEPTEGTYDVNVIKNENLSIHFLMLGNKYTGDSVYIKAGDTDILIDAGSRYGSASTIANYVNHYCTDGKLEYVIATHAHQDHIEGFVTGSSNGGGVLDRFKVDTVIKYALQKTDSNISGYFTNKLNALKTAGTNVYTAAECIDNANGAQKEYTLAEGITMEILDQKYYRQTTSNENNYSVCLMIKQGENNYLFTGDLEGDGETSLAQLNPDLPKVKLWKGGHHGSYTAGSTTLLQKIQPETVCICTCMGTTEYSTGKHAFPAQEFVERVAQYTDRVYCTTDGTQFDTNNNCVPANGNIVFACTDGQITMYFSNNNLKLKDTEWFKNTSWFQNNSSLPANWRS